MNLLYTSLKWVVIVFISLYAQLLHAQYCPNPDSVTITTQFTKNYTLGLASYKKELSDFELTYDSGYAIVTNSTEVSDGADLTKLDAAGNFLWRRTFLHNGFCDGTRVAETADSGFAILSAYEMDTLQNGIVYRPVVIKTDKLGNKQWMKMFVNDTLSVFIRNIEVAGNNIYIFYTGKRKTANGVEENYFIAKMDGAGNVLWHKNYFISNLAYEGAFNVTPQHDIYVSCRVSTRDLGISRIDSNGNIVWSRIHGPFNTGFEPNVLAVDSNGVMVGGTTTSSIKDFRLMLLDKNGIVKWTKSYNSTNSDQVYGIHKIPTGYVVSGKSFAGGDYATALMQIDTAGNFIWAKRYTSSSIVHLISSVQRNDGYVMLGQKTIINSTYLGGTLVLRTDNLGIAACRWSCIQYTTTTYNNTAVTDVGRAGDITGVMDFDRPDTARTITAVDDCTEFGIMAHGSDAACLNEGTATVEVLFGVGPFTYTWSNGETTPTINNLAAGTYRVTVSNPHGIAVDSVVVHHMGYLVVDITDTTVQCAQQNNAVLGVAVTTGTGPYTYLWSTGAVTDTIINLSAGPYQVTVTGAGGCSATAYAGVGIDTLSVTIGIIQNVRCGVSGRIQASPFSTWATNTYLWNTGATTRILDNVYTGTYTVTATNIYGCTATASIVMDSVNSPYIDLTATHTTCGINNGTITVNAPTGYNYSYNWDNGSSFSGTLTNAAAGTHTVIVRTLNFGCNDTLTATVNPSPGFSIATTANATTCGLDNGSATVSASPEMKPYTYQWQNGSTDTFITNLWPATFNVTVTGNTGCTRTGTVNIAASTGIQPLLNVSNTRCGDMNGAITANLFSGTGPFNFAWSQGDTTQTITGLAPAYYEVTVTGNGSCSASVGAEVSVSDTMKLLASSLPTTCGLNNGFTVVNITGGVYPFSVQWSNGDTNQVIFNAAAGVYDVSVTDAIGCVSEASVTVNVSAPITLSMAVANTTCGRNNGSATATVATGNGPFTYRWNSNLSLTANLSNAAAGIYTVTVTGAANCSGTASVSIGSSTALTISTSTVNTTCGNANGSVSINVLTGKSPYTYQWSSGTGNATLPNLSAGNYSITVSDSTSCTATASRTINASTPLVFTLSPSDATCGANNGQVTTSITSGTAPYRYAWSNSDTTANISALGTGNYNVTLTDTRTCTASASATVGFLPGLLLSTSVHDATCGNNNGSARVSINAGTGPYTFNWSNSNPTDSVSNLAPGSYTVTVTGAASCSATAGITINASAGLVLSSSTTATSCGNANGAASINVTSGTGPFIYGWSNSTGLAAITNVASGTYTVTVTGAGACSATSSINIGASVALSATTTITGTTCGLANGAAVVNILTGTSPYNYTWSNGEANAAIQNMAANIYTVSISDAAGCADTLTADIDSSVALVVTTTSTSTSCGAVNGVAQVDITSGILPYTYLWNTSDNTAQLTGILSGTYTVTVNDGTGCSASAAATVGSSGGLVLSNSVTNASCGLNNGSITINIAAGTGPYVYNWSNGESAAGIMNLDSGTYRVTVTGNGGCSATGTAVVNMVPGLALGTLSTGSGCINNGVAGVQVNTGQGPFIYQWSNGGSTNTITNVAAGTYLVTATGAGNCTATASINVNLLDSLIISSTVTNTSCGINNGMVLINIVSGTAPVTYLWSNDSTNAYTTNLSPANYTVTATDADGCTATASAAINSSLAITLTTSSTATLCNNANGAATFNVTGATAPYIHVWDNGDTSTTASALAAGIYTLEITDARGCQATSSTTVAASTGLVATIQTVPTNCGFNNGSASAAITSGTAPYTYAWSNGSSDSTISNLTPGTYILTVTDANGCITGAGGSIGSSDSNRVNLTADKTLMCPGDSALICAPAGSVSYLWNTGETTRCIAGMLAGYYAVTATDTLGCPATNRIPITVRVLPPVSVTVAGDTLTSFNALTYQWYLDGQPIAGANTGLYVARVNGYYQVKITDTTGCEVMSTPVPVIIMGVQKLSEDGAVKVAPNPLGEGSWRLTVTDDLLGAEVELYDEQGRVVYQSIVTAPQSEIAVRVAQGVYIMRIQAERRNYSIRLIKL